MTVGSALMKVRLDAVDWKILRALQADGRMTNVELARRAGILAGFRKSGAAQLINE